jgi:hypothetical protein
MTIPAAAARVITSPANLVLPTPASPSTSSNRASPPSAPSRKDSSRSRPTKATGSVTRPAHQPAPARSVPSRQTQAISGPGAPSQARAQPARNAPLNNRSELTGCRSPSEARSAGGSAACRMCPVMAGIPVAVAAGQVGRFLKSQVLGDISRACQRAGRPALPGALGGSPGGAGRYGSGWRCRAARSRQPRPGSRGHARRPVV